MPKGYLLLVLHAHLPYVRHPEYERFGWGSVAAQVEELMGVAQAR